MPVSKTNKKRRDKVLRYAAMDADYQRKLRQYKYEKELGYEYPKDPPARLKILYYLSGQSAA